MLYMLFYHHARLATALQLAMQGLVLMVICVSYPISVSLAGTRTITKALPDNDQLTIGVWIPNRNLEAEEKLLSSLTRPGGSAYHQWLSSTKFQERFAPTDADISTVRRFFVSAHLRLLPDSRSNLLLARGTIAQIRRIFHTSINMTGKYYSPLSSPKVPTAIAPIVTGVFGLTNLPMTRAKIIPARRSKKPGTIATSYGGGVAGSGLTPSQIAGIYDAAPLYNQGNTGQGTTLGLAEFSGYTSNDITAYEDAYHLPHMHLFPIPVLGGAQDHTGASEVELDIELQMAMAPSARRLLIYNAPPTELGTITTYQRIAQDNLADAISTSWGDCEYDMNTMNNASNIMQAENQIFLRMALQGQSMFAASGDSGAYDCAGDDLLPPFGQELQVDSPGDQPYVTSVGGTSFQGENSKPLFDPGQNQHPNYPGQLDEKPWSWNCTALDCDTPTLQSSAGAGGGGVSHIWSEPDYTLNPITDKYYPGVVGWYSRTGIYCQQKPGVLCREVPDVSINADPSTGYSFYCTDLGDSGCIKTGWEGAGGTSTSAPLWAGIAALDIRQHQNQRLGLLNYLLYPFDSPTNYTHQFHDIISNLSNGMPFMNERGQTVSGYAATRAYDMSTGIGTPDIAQLVRSMPPMPILGKG